MAKSPKKVVRSWKPVPVAFKRDNDNAEFYNSWKWRKKAKEYKNRFPLCCECEKEGMITPATVVDHKVRVNDGGDKYDDSNLQSMCEFHHNKKSAAERGGYGVKSL